MGEKTSTLIPFALLMLAACHLASGVQAAPADPPRGGPVEVHAPCGGAEGLRLREALHAAAPGVPMGSDRADELIGALRATCLAPLGGPALADAGPHVLWRWLWPAPGFGGGASWLQEASRPEGTRAAWFVLPPALRVGAAEVVAAAPELIALPGRGCLPTAHWIAEAERLHELEAYDRGEWSQHAIAPRTAASGSVETELGALCLVRTAAATRSAPSAWRECLLRLRDRRALMPVGEFCQPERGVLELSHVVRPTAGGAACRRVVTLDIADGRVTASGDCGPQPSPQIPVEAVRRAALFALLRPHLVVGSAHGEVVAIPDELGPGTLDPVAVTASLLPSYAPAPPPVSHAEMLQYRIRTPSGEREGACRRRGYDDLGALATCSAAQDVWILTTSDDSIPSGMDSCQSCANGGRSR